jgi:ubiquinone/menaquinone biosynthesis C-methylase UbiE
MSVFNLYAAYYDLLYPDKDYSAETEYVADLITEAAPAQTVLDLGCGTGAHAFHFARRGFTVHGVDLSAEMIERAQRRSKSSEPLHCAPAP